MSIIQTEIFAPLPDIEQGRPYVLGGDPDGINIVYCCARGVVLRNIENPKKCEVELRHAHKVTAAQYSPSGKYVCSGDAVGNIKIWSTDNKEAKVKEHRPIGAPITDIAWGPESKRVAVSGYAGVTKHGAVIMADGGNKVGDITDGGRGNSISYRQVRPYRIAVGDDKFFTSIYHGPPFKSQFNYKDHTKFVQTVRYSPDGKYLATGSSDGHIFLYNGETSELLGQMGDEKKGAHSGGVYSISWSPDSKEFLSSSGDRSTKMWNAETKQEVVQFTFDQHQNASLWMGDYMLSVSLTGQINYLDRNNPSTPSRVLEGHSKSITKVIALPSGHATGDMTGKMLKWNTETGEAQTFTGTGHTNKVVGLIYDSCNDEIVSASWNDKILFTPASSLDFSAGTSLSLDSQPICMSRAGDGYFVLICHQSIVLVKDKKVVFNIPNEDEFSPSCVAAHGKEVAIDGRRNIVEIYHIEGDTLVKSDTSFSIEAEAFALSYSPDGSMLAACSGNKEIFIFIVADGYQKYDMPLYGHHMKPNVLAWSPNSQYLATSGMDGSIRLWNVPRKTKQNLERAHEAQFVLDMAWLSDECLLSIGDDLLTRQWSVTW